MQPLAAQLGSPATRYGTPLRIAERRSARPGIASAENASAPKIATRLARRRRLEAVLFVAREAMPLRRLAQLANLADGTEARTLLRDLQQSYRARRGALTINQVAGGYRLMTRPALAPWIERFAQPQEEVALTPAAAETLTVVAYRQPVVRAEVEAIRGAQSGDHLRQLMQHGLLRIVGRSEELGRPILYGTTKHFLQEYGLKSLEELPPVEGLPAEGPPANMAAA